MTDKSLQAIFRDYNTTSERIAELEAELKSLKAAQSGLKEKIVDNIGDKAEVQIGKYTAKTWTSVRHNVDVNRMMDEDIETYLKYKKPDTVSQYCRVKEG